MVFSFSLGISVKTWSLQLGSIWGRSQKEMSPSRYFNTECFFFKKMVLVMTSVMCDLSVDLGYRRSAKVQEHVGALLSRCQRDCVSIQVWRWKLNKHLAWDWTYCKCMNNMLIFVLLLLIFRYMVDAADREKVEASRNELHNLLDKPQLQGIPVGVLPTPVLIYVVFLGYVNVGVCDYFVRV